MTDLGNGGHDMEKACRETVAETGRILLEKGLVARTWGNISARVDANRFAISPSGLGYEHMQEADVPVYDMATDTYEGSRKPSSEKKIHAASYRLYPDVLFVIHTHQDYATAISLTDTKDLEMTEEEKAVLGKIAIADYGLPGTKKLSANVELALKDARIVLMKHHGALILGTDREDAINKAELLEAVCKRAVVKRIGEIAENRQTEQVDEKLLASSENMLFTSTPEILKMADKGGFVAQIDDMAQMLGRKIRSVPNDNAAILHALNKQDAVLVKNAGLVIMTEQKDDAEALKLLIEKAAMAKVYTLSRGIQADLSLFDCMLMRCVYKMKYSKKKEG